MRGRRRFGAERLSQIHVPKAPCSEADNKGVLRVRKTLDLQFQF